MGPDGPQLSAVPGGVDNAVDQVVRLHEFIKRHPEVAVTSPRQNGTAVFQAVWTADEPPQNPGIGDQGIVVLATHEELRRLLDYLEARFDRGTSG